MSIDSRLRQGLERSASGATTDLVDDLPDALRRGRRRKRVLVAARITTVAAVVAIVAVVGPRLVSSIRNEQPAAPTPTPSPQTSCSPTSTASVRGCRRSAASPAPPRPGRHRCSATAR